MLGNYLDEVRKKAPLIHNITNYVTINDVANMVLACGASPIMSDEPTDIEEITSICQGLNINMGMLNPRKIESMQKAGKNPTNCIIKCCWIRSEQDRVRSEQRRH